MAQNLVSNTRRANWIGTWNGFQMGYMDEVDPALKLILEDIKVGTVGKAVLGQRFLALEGEPTFNIREPTAGLIGSLTPWGGGSATLPGSAPATPWQLTPPLNTDIYAYAAALVLQPTDLAELGTPDHSQDIHLVAAVPISVPNSFKRDGNKDDIWPVKFKIFPARGSLPALVYGYVGASAPSGYGTITL